MKQLTISFLLLIIPGILAEWEGTLTVPSLQLSYKNLTRIDHERGFRGDGVMCIGDSDLQVANCTSHDHFYWVTEMLHQDELEQMLTRAEEINAHLLILITDEKEIDYDKEITIPIFTLPFNIGQQMIGDLENEQFPLDINIYYHMLCKLYLDNCADYETFVVLFTVFTFVSSTQLWFGVLSTWIVNNHIIHAHQVHVFHKFLTIILAFKLLNVLADMSLWRSCPFTSEFYIGISVQLLTLLSNQCRTLYETSYFNLLIFLSKGLMITRAEFTRREFNYLAIVCIMIYILDSASNILGADAIGVTATMFAIVIGHTTYFGYQQIKNLRAGWDVAQQSGIRDIINVQRQKKRMFIAMACIVTSYYILEFFIHIILVLIIQETDIGTYDKYAIFSGAHEGMEITIVSALYILYRARAQLRFWDLGMQDSQELTSILKFYRASYPSSPVNSSEPIAIIKLPGVIDEQYKYDNFLIAKEITEEPSLPLNRTGSLEMQPLEHQQICYAWS